MMPPSTNWVAINIVNAATNPKRARKQDAGGEAVFTLGFPRLHSRATDSLSSENEVARVWNCGQRTR